MVLGLEIPLATREQMQSFGMINGWPDGLSEWFVSEQLSQSRNFMTLLFSECYERMFSDKVLEFRG